MRQEAETYLVVGFVRSCVRLLVQSSAINRKEQHIAVSIHNLGDVLRVEILHSRSTSTFGPGPYAGDRNQLLSSHTTPRLRDYDMGACGVLGGLLPPPQYSRAHDGPGRDCLCLSRSNQGCFPPFLLARNRWCG